MNLDLKEGMELALLMDLEALGFLKVQLIILHLGKGEAAVVPLIILEVQVGKAKAASGGFF